MRHSLCHLSTERRETCDVIKRRATEICTLETRAEVSFPFEMYAYSSLLLFTGQQHGIMSTVLDNKAMG